MYLEHIFKNSGTLATIAGAIETLRSAHFFAALLEVGAERSLNSVSTEYHKGYYDCLRDMEDYRNRIAPVVEKMRVVSDFGSLRSLLNNGEITQEEYDSRIAQRRK